MKRRHRMPFGAELLEDGTRFRLWAPGAHHVEVEIGAGGTTVRHSMVRGGGGWFEANRSGIGAGARYAFRIDSRLSVPDPASRSNPDGVHAPSVVVDPEAYDWRDAAWRGRAWEEAVVYELHIGTFTPAGTFAGAIDRLDDLVDLGVTALELMPVAQFAGKRNWGYDGVLPYAPAASYGTPDDLKRLVDAAHARGLMMLLDVVYNHFGPEGNYIGEYAPAFFNARHHTPWGPAINFDGEGSRTVRDFFIENALYWIEEFHFDGLRLDAVHAIADDSRPDIVAEMAAAVHDAARDRAVHLVIENDRNESRRLHRDAAGRPVAATAQWNDDVHHALHVITTGESDGYYLEFADRPLEHLGRALAQGFAWQGELSPWRNGEPRGEPSAMLPATAFIDFTQTHDQVGNRAFGERIAMLAEPRALRAAIACVLMSPAVPMLFMGEEFAASTPFLFFCDFGPELSAAVTRGRREEFRRFERFRDAQAQATIPDPNQEATFEASKLQWHEASALPGSEWRSFYRRLLAIRREHIVPRLHAMSAGGTFDARDDGLLRLRWGLGEATALQIVANFSPSPLAGVARAPGKTLYASGPSSASAHATGALAPYEVVVTLDAAP